MPERVNPAYDPSKAIGGENVPYQESKGIGGFFRRLLGDESNRMNIEAQQAQGAKWEAEAAEQQKEERLLNRMREADKPTQARFEATQRAAEIAEANRVAAENKRLELEGQRLGLTKQQIEDARLDRVARLQAEKEDRDIRIENMRTQNAINDAEFGLRSRVANQPRFGVHTTDKGGMTIFNQTTGEPVRTYTPGGMGMIKDAKGNMVPGMTQGGWEDYVPPVTVPKDLPDSPQVDRSNGGILGGPLLDTKLPPGGGVRMGGALPATPAAQAAPAVVTQPRSATLADTLVNLPGMGSALDMSYYMTPERTARLEESKRRQKAESLQRTRAMQEQAYGDLGPSMF